MMLPPSNSLKVLEMVKNKLEKIFNNIFFASDLSRLKLNVLEANNYKNYKTIRLYKNPNLYILL